ncbi:rod shape-determining protein MreD [Pinibacter aurantiacus]|uniref:Rod shape-determining protein MreD n=1 Tax=Pinibacter aurantiacus TaxID=2851599 RepID=A0A9E2S9D6_9BACT|nr:rod shape-determining protein MreD [Pinibacter aurantiacus]MBV4357987.1 rod shape-determining protein MreD [Pinibacter aurantiacus]
MSITLKNIIRFVLFILVQVFVLHKVPPLHEYVVPYVYFLYVLWLPFKTSRAALMFVAFLFGLTLDYFLKCPGLHAAACVLIAYIRPFLINILISQEGADTNYSSPSITSMGWAPYATYVVILTLIHNIYLVLLEWLQFGNFLYFLGKILATTAMSLLLIIIAELLFNRKEKFRTNTV